MAKKKNQRRIGFLPDEPEETLPGEELPIMPTLLEKAITEVARHYEPCNDFAEMSEYITTQKLYDICQAFYPSEGFFGYSLSLVAELAYLHFEFRYFPALGQMVWMVKEI